MRNTVGVLLVVGALAVPALALADGPSPSPSASPSASPTTSTAVGAPAAAAAARRGVAVLATAGLTDAAWSLAQKVYADATLRPTGIDDARARVLAGETAPTPELSELLELRDGVKGDDAASRQLLGAIADKLSIAAIVVVFRDGDGRTPVARVFHTDTRTFDAARYSADAGGGWEGTLKLLSQQLGSPPLALASQAPAPAPTATHASATAATAATTASKTPATGSDSKSFWQSPWFWVAIGTAVLVGAGVLIATNTQSSDTIHLQLHIP